MTPTLDRSPFKQISKPVPTDKYTKMPYFETLAFDNRFTRALPADPLSTNSRRQVQGACYSRVHPTPVREPKLVACSPENFPVKTDPRSAEMEKELEILRGLLRR